MKLISSLALVMILICSTSCKDNARSTASVPDQTQMWEHKAQPAIR